ncbi:LysR family transcriptional regulator [Streptomyces similanensis]|uniref:HTH lysR-type domain-containing protein n=1 Tax=Streptomyces similanensis TaxID=1274988 RepID=A0ABP9KSF6_9ACTN
MVERHETATFITPAGELHFARAAERLHVSPGRVSQTIKALERQMVARCSSAASRRVALTTAPPAP